MSQWFYCKDTPPPTNVDVLVFTGESQFPYEVMKYHGKHFRTVEDFRGEWEEEYDYWSDNNGSILDRNPVAWQFIDDEFTRNGEIWVEGRVV